MAKPPPSTVDHVVSLAKRRGFVYPCGEIYGGKRVNINGMPLNPMARQYPKDFIHTGISAIVAPDGTLVKQTDWKKSETILANIPLNNLQTFYVKNGDYVLRIANFASLIFILLLLLKWLVNKKKN